jgi:hypothetical protein
MIIHCADDEKRSISLKVDTGTKWTTGKEYIYCELSYRDKKTNKSYNKVFPATKFDDISKRFYALYNNAIPAAEIPALFK